MALPLLLAESKSDLVQMVMESKGVRETTAQLHVMLFLNLVRRYEVLRAFPDATTWLFDPAFMANLIELIKKDIPPGSSRRNHFAALRAMIDTAAATQQEQRLPTDAIDRINRLLVDGIRESVTRMTREEGDNRLLRGEQKTWKPFHMLEENRDLLEAEEHESMKKHLQYLIYEIFVSMADVGTFRRDIMTNMYTSRSAAPSEESNYIQWGSSDDDDDDRTSAAFVFRHSKTSDHHGTLVVELDPELVDVLRDSLERYPRAALFPKTRDMSEPLETGNATKFLQSAWKMGGEEPGPTFNNLRSAVATRFWDTHPTFNERNDFAMMSGTSFVALSRSYYKLE